MAAFRWRLVLCIVLIKAACFGHIVFEYWRHGASSPVLASIAKLSTYHDASHYTEIARDGYRFEERVAYPTYAFFPLYPLLLRALLGIEDIWLFRCAALMLNVFLSTLGGLWVAEVVRKDYGGRAAFACVALLFVAPSAVFFDMLYSESLYLFLTSGLLLSMSHGRVLGQIACGTLGGLLRVQGVALSAPVLSEYGYRKWFVATLPVASFAGYGVFVWAHTGAPFGVISVQESWGREFEMGGLWESGNWLDWMYAAGVGAALLVLLVRQMLNRRDVAFFVVSVAIPVASGSLMSFARFCGVVYPLFLVYAMASGPRRVKLFYPALCALVAGRILVNQIVVRGHFAG